MKKPSSRIRHEISKLQEQLRAAEAREAERIGRIALRAGLGDIEFEEAVLQAALENLVSRFRGGQGVSNGGKGSGEAGGQSTTAVASGAPQGNNGEA